MEDLIKKTIAILKLHIKSNLEVINLNQTKIKQILQEPKSSERSVNFERHYAVNKNLLSENNDYIKLQLALINFLEKYKNTDIMKESPSAVNTCSPGDQEEIFNLTVTGKLPYNKKHPNFTDQDFFDRLICYYQEREEYEKCHELLSIIRK
ncbi:MAG: hypothetical protein JW723_08185 [Bacteroidales bacterium]|nr:hypothetical protein [Bacteroidales bacterium]